VVSRILQPLAAGFKLGIALRGAAYRRGWFKTRQLNRPVVSVGNLTVGGTGKTPFVAFLAQLLQKRGWNPVILTRGYGRSHSGRIVALEPSSNRSPHPRAVGDEAALLARKLPHVPIVVGADRHQAGRQAEQRFNVDVHVLDDGFQHLALARDVDVVLLDVTQELSDGALLPLGRMREPWAALQRAHFVILTRTELGDPLPLEARVREVNPEAGIFHARTVLCALVDVATGIIYPPTAFQDKPVHAFCGLANPRAFFANLRQWGFSVVAESAFPDHHVYQARSRAFLDQEIRVRDPLPAALLTTEKDAVNLPPLGRAAIPILACTIQTEVREVEAFEDALLARLERVRVKV
jgi:tetraacyldisaccharide 4'-kinase